MTTDNLTYLDPDGWVRKPVPQEVLNQVLVILGTHHVYPLRFKGNITLTYKKELVPNPSNPNLMDVSKVYEYAGDFEVILKTFKNGKEKTMISHYYILGGVAEVLEVGSYWDRRS